MPRLNKISFLLPPAHFLLLILSYRSSTRAGWPGSPCPAIALCRAKTLAGPAGLTAGVFFTQASFTDLSHHARKRRQLLGFRPGPLSLIMSLNLSSSPRSAPPEKAGPGAWPYVFAAGWALLEYGKVLLSSRRSGSLVHAGLHAVDTAARPGGLADRRLRPQRGRLFSGALAGTLFVSEGTPWRRALRFAPAVLVSPLSGAMAAVS